MTNNPKTLTEPVIEEIEPSPDNENKYNLFIIAACIVALIVMGLYFWNFFGSSLSKNPSDWGVLGDYVGGILNPALAFITIILLIQTIKQQQAAIKQTEIALQQSKKELEHSRQALTDNAKALELNQKELTIANQTYKEQSASFKQQNEYIQRQNFESHFFSLFSVLKDIISSYEYRNKRGNAAITILYTSVRTTVLNNFQNAPKKQLKLIRSEVSINGSFQDLLPVFENTIFHILDFIDSASFLNDKKKWISIVKSIITTNSLLLLLFIQLSSNNKKVKQLYIDSNFFLNITLNRDDDMKILHILKQDDEIKQLLEEKQKK